MVSGHCVVIVRPNASRKAVLDRQCEGWEASLLRFSLTVPVSDAAGLMMARMFRSAGIAVRRSAAHGAQRMDGSVDDATAAALLGIRFTFADADITGAASREKAAKEADARRQADAKARMQTRTCAECGKPIPSDRNARARTCSGTCLRERNRRQSIEKYHSRRRAVLAGEQQ